MNLLFKVLLLMILTIHIQFYILKEPYLLFYVVILDLLLTLLILPFKTYWNLTPASEEQGNLYSNQHVFHSLHSFHDHFKPALSNQIFYVATFATFVATKSLLSPQLWEIGCKKLFIGLVHQKTASSKNFLSQHLKDLLPHLP